MEHYLNVSVISFKLSKNRKALNIQRFHGIDLEWYRNIGLPELASFHVFH